MFARIFSRRHKLTTFSDAGFLGILRLKSQFFYVCASVVSYVAFVLTLFVPHLSIFWSLGRALFRDYGIS